MTEAEWLACGEPRAMLRFLRGRVSDRKFRLFGSACYLNLWSKVPVAELYRDVLRASEAYAERQITKQEFKVVRKRGDYDKAPRVFGEAWEVAQSSAQDCSGESFNWTPVGDGRAYRSVRERPEVVSTHCTFVRDIFGNPFRPVTFAPSWRTDTAVSLAKQMYESREFGAMPILADALQDAGCDNLDILNHCRGEGPHVRGCWVVDLVLGKG